MRAHESQSYSIIPSESIFRHNLYIYVTNTPILSCFCCHLLYAVQAGTDRTTFSPGKSSEYFIASQQVLKNLYGFCSLQPGIFLLTSDPSWSASGPPYSLTATCSECDYVVGCGFEVLLVMGRHDKPEQPELCFNP